MSYSLLYLDILSLGWFRIKLLNKKYLKSIDLIWKLKVMKNLYLLFIQNKNLLY